MILYLVLYIALLIGRFKTWRDQFMSHFSTRHPRERGDPDFQ
jgi:hypothetical protein